MLLLAGWDVTAETGGFENENIGAGVDFSSEAAGVAGIAGAAGAPNENVA